MSTTTTVTETAYTAMADTENAEVAGGTQKLVHLPQGMPYIHPHGLACQGAKDFATIKKKRKAKDKLKVKFDEMKA